MAKFKVTAESFLKNLNVDNEAAISPTRSVVSTEKDQLRLTKPAGSRVGLKHFGGYIDRETMEKVAILRARLDLDNSELIERAVDDLYSREIAARKFGDR